MSGITKRVSPWPRFALSQSLCWSAVYALDALFFYANWWSLGLRAFYPFCLGLLCLPLGALWLYAMGGILSLTGRLLGGKASVGHFLPVVAWSFRPHAVSLLVWLVLLLARPEHVFIHDYGAASSILINSVQLMVGGWSLTLLLKGIREVQVFSKARSFFNAALAYLVYTIFFFFATSLICCISIPW